MAMIDDNNSGIPAGAGKDPLEELDRELEQLRLEMGDDDAPAPSPDDKDREPASAPAEETYHEEKPAPARRHAADEAPRSPRAAIIILALILALTGVAVGAAVYFGNRQTDDRAEEPTTPPVTVNDPDMGTLELNPPTDASVNEYQEKNLTLGEDGYYTYTIDGAKVSEMGVDLSYIQGEIDFGQVKESGIDFVMLRIGGRGWGGGSLYADDKFDEYYEQAKAAGLKIGAYFYSQAISPEEAAEEADYCIGLLDGRALDYPLAIDWENIGDEPARTDDVSDSELTAIAAAFCETVGQAGYKPLVYANSYQILQRYDFNTMKNYDFWLADYREMPEQETMYYHYSIWQYSDSGSVPGISEPVDLNLCLNATD